mmetsp:Transcript_66838/g.131537  ORF Transcript_66838/g.131537 Transcript_66838/m.131537 type:complete len:89 (-) Transcript_66838:86-352(-)
MKARRPAVAAVVEGEDVVVGAVLLQVVVASVAVVVDVVLLVVVASVVGVEVVVVLLGSAEVEAEGSLAVAVDVVDSKLSQRIMFDSIC